MNTMTTPARVGALRKGSWPFLKGLAIAMVSLNVIIPVVSQLQEIELQNDYNQQLRPRIEQMKQEQQHLLLKGLVAPRYIGAFRAHNAHGVQTQIGSSDFASQRASLGPWNASALLQKIDGQNTARSKPGLGLLHYQQGISVGLVPHAGAVGILSDAAFVYRHEEAHSLEVEHQLAIQSPTAWPSEVSSIVALRLQAVRSLQVSPDSTNWREQWMHSIYTEAFADAFAILTLASKGDSVMQQKALDTQLLRMVGSQDPEERNILSAIKAAGSGHSVDMASFLAGQLSAKDVQALDREALLSLSQQIASASLAWSVARQGSLIGFFSQEGQQWWMGLSEKSGIDSQTRLDQWSAWKTEAQSATPHAVFGDFQWRAGGLNFKAKGLPEPAGVQWRFDGQGGVVGFAQGVELGRDGPIHARRMSFSTEQLTLETLGQIFPERKSDIDHAIPAPLWTQQALAWRMKKEPSAEVARFKKMVGEAEAKHYSSNRLLAPVSFKSVTFPASQSQPTSSDNAQKLKPQSHTPSTNSLEPAPFHKGQLEAYRNGREQLHETVRTHASKIGHNS